MRFLLYLIMIDDDTETTDLVACTKYMNCELMGACFIRQFNS